MNPHCICPCSVPASDIYLRLSSTKQAINSGTGKRLHFNLTLAINIVLHLCFLGTRRGGGAVGRDLRMQTNVLLICRQAG
jgi:hypothetical protein